MLLYPSGMDSNDTKHKPATPLPWSEGEDRQGRRRIFGPDGIECARALWKVVKTKQQVSQNRVYIAHAANAYPKLVAALREASECLDDWSDDDTRSRAIALLRELGEDK